MNQFAARSFLDYKLFIEKRFAVTQQLSRLGTFFLRACLPSAPQRDETAAEMKPRQVKHNKAFHMSVCLENRRSVHSYTQLS